MLCDEKTFGTRVREANKSPSGASLALPSGAALALPYSDDDALGQLYLCVESAAGDAIDREEQQLLLVHGLLLLLDYDPCDPSRTRGSVNVARGDGEAREMATAERGLLRRLRWRGSSLMCSTDSPHGATRGEYEMVEGWGLVARERPNAWWLHDRKSHEGRRWRSAAAKRFWAACGTTHRYDKTGRHAHVRQPTVRTVCKG